MGRYATDTGTTTYTPAPVGTHVARCFRIIDIGTQHGEYQGKPTRRNQVIVGWELPDELIDTEEGEKPIVASRFYTNSLGEKANLRRDLEAWRGRTFSDEELNRFDLETILGVPCLLTIVKSENGKTKVTGVTGLPKGTKCPPQVNPSSTFWLDEFDQEKFDGLSKGIQDIIKRSDEFSAASNPDNQMPPPDADHSYDIHDDDIPF